MIYGYPHLKGVPDLGNGHVEGSVKRRANHAMENVPGKNAGLLAHFNTHKINKCIARYSKSAFQIFLFLSLQKREKMPGHIGGRWD